MFVAGLAISTALFARAGLAQFHGGKPAAGQAVPSANGTAVASEGGLPTIYRGENQQTGMIDTRAVDGAKLVYTDVRNAVVWGRAIYHADDSYTESKLDDATNSLSQETKSANGVTLMRRLISLDAKGNPSEILIYDGRGQYRYRGQILYDLRGRFAEEQIYDTGGQLLRRTIQEYEPSGRPLPLKVVDDLAKIPPDLKLVITQADGTAKDARRAEQAYQSFLREAREVRPAAGSTASGSVPPGGEKPRKPGLLSRIFGPKN